MERKKSKVKGIIITLVIIAAALAGIFYILNKNKASNQAATDEVAKQNVAITVRVDTATVREMDASYVGNGTFIPKQEVIVGAEVGGRVARVLVKEGDFVRAGQTLAIVEADKQNVGVANAQASLNNARADLARYESAFQTGGVTRQQLDLAKLKYETERNNLKSAQISASDVTIKTSVAGIINARKIEPGSYVSPGTPAFDIVNIGALKLRVNVDEKSIVNVKVGQSVPVTVSVFPDKTYSGKVTFIAPKSDGSLNFPVEVEVANGKGSELRAGMYGTATFGAGHKTSALVIPRTAFVGSVSDNKVFVIKDGKAVESNVQSGRNFGDYIEVLSGLNGGDQVIISGQVNLFNQTPVEIIK